MGFLHLAVAISVDVVGPKIVVSLSRNGQVGALIRRIISRREYVNKSSAEDLFELSHCSV